MDDWMMLLLETKRELTSRQETDSSAHLDKGSKHHHVSSNLTVRSAKPQSASQLFSKTRRPGVLFSQEAWLYAGSGWLSLSVRQRVATGQFSSLNCKDACMACLVSGVLNLYIYTMPKQLQYYTSGFCVCVCLSVCCL